MNIKEKIISVLHKEQLTKNRLSLLKI